MKNFSIQAVPGNEEDKILPSLKITDNGKYYATIWADATISFNSEKDYEIEDLKYFCKIGSMFFTFYNNIKTGLKIIKSSLKSG